MFSRAFMLLALLAASTAIAAAKPYKEMFPDRTYQNPQAQRLVEDLDYQQGVVALGDIGVELRVPPAFYFLSASHARKVIVDIWGNPPVTAEKVLGMVLPATKTPVDETWGAVITFDEDGYVSDEDAGKINYGELLQQMQEGTRLASEERVKQGFSTLRLVGWASPPYYDQPTKKLHWAKELEFGGEARHTLNYDVRALGRKGVLKINFVAGIDQLAEIKDVIPAVMAMPQFTQGFRYEDYMPGADKVAAYGIGGLIAGKALAKVGFFALALAFLKKGWILVVLAIGGIWKLASRWFGSGPRA
jgi:uncharacterized membrane-anchored protein